MTDAATPYPLRWPAGRARTASTRRKGGKFRTAGERSCRGYGLQALSVADALERLQREFDLIGARFPVVSSNIETRLDGRPRSGQKEPGDSGVAVYFQLRGRPYCLPCDTYFRVADNIAAIAAHIEATRAIKRHGVATVEEMFAGFQALPAPAAIDWRQVLELHRESVITRAMIEAAYRRLARERHPDIGGSDRMMADLNAARDAALREVA